VDSRTDTSASGTPRPDRRARRRRETIEEILDLSVEVMTEHGVNGLTLAEVARRLGVQTPSLYRYFPSLGAVYDALFERGMRAHLQVQREAMAAAGQPGLPALIAGLDASGSWALENQALAQLMFWRPVPSFEPSPAAMEPSEEMVALQKHAIEDAVEAGQLGRPALDDGAYVASVLIKGVMTQAMANEPHLPWGEGRFSPTFTRLMQLLPALYPTRP
jgi:AcrR family transcriptional regulator